MTNKNIYFVILADNTIIFVDSKEEAEKYKRKESHD